MGKLIRKIEIEESKIIDNNSEKKIVHSNYSDDFISRNIQNIFNNNYKESVLCVGEVQSGKTANIIRCIEYAVNNGYKFIIVFGGITNMLLEQSKRRIEESTKNNNIVFLNEINEFNRIRSYLNSEKIIVSIVIKTEHYIKHYFQDIDMINLENPERKVLIIDDECDYASIATTTNSSINKKISELYERIHYGKLLNFTGTPFANILTKKSQGNKSDRIVVLENYTDYCGCKVFNDSNCYIVENVNKNNYDIDFLKKIYIYWLISTAIAMHEIEDFKSEFLINIEIINEEQNKLKNDMLHIVKNFWNNEFINFESWIEKYLIQWMYEKYIYLIEEIKKNIIKIYQYFNNNNAVIVLNSLEKTKNFISGKNDFVIIISGFMASRGFTFENLLFELFLNNPEIETNIDSLLQKCRWFGNRKKRMEFMRIIINEQIINALEDAEEYIGLFEKGKIMDINKMGDKIRELDFIKRTRRKVMSTNYAKQK